MTDPLPSGQNRAPGLYDEQLQREQQEKSFVKGRPLAVGKPFFQLTAPLVPELTEQGA